jgi:hybrid cluster-associated redox disulfide protein
MTQPASIADLTVEALLQQWPQTAVVFHRHNMACVGCAVAPFYTVADAVHIYDLSLDPFLAELAEVIEGATAVAEYGDDFDE